MDRVSTMEERLGTPDLINNSLNRNYGLADMPHRVVATLTYASPFGANGPFALSNKIGRAVLGDWTTGSVIVAQSGLPFTISMSNARNHHFPHRQSSRPVHASATGPPALV